MKSGKKAVSSLLRKQLENVLTALNEVSDVGRVEGFHKLRVEIKKFRAIAGILRNKVLYPEYYDQWLKPVFKLAGRIRQLHIIQDLISTHSPDQLSTIQTILAQRESALVKQWWRKQTYFEKNLKSFIDLFNQSDLQELKCKPGQYVHRLDKKIQSFVKNKIPVSQLHDFRKLLKKRIYSSTLFDIPVHDKNHYDNLQSLIGEWHDYHNALVYLQRIKNPDTNLIHVSDCLKEGKKKQLSAIRQLLSEW
jgi:CHAD domain-containing protein